jgi:hypothetical protein
MRRVWIVVVCAMTAVAAAGYASPADGRACFRCSDDLYNGQHRIEYPPPELEIKWWSVDTHGWLPGYCNGGAHYICEGDGLEASAEFRAAENVTGATARAMMEKWPGMIRITTDGSRIQLLDCMGQHIVMERALSVAG